MQRTIFAVLFLLAVCFTALGQVQLTNLDQKSFKIDVTGPPTNVVNLFLRSTQFSPSTTGWVLTNISGVFGGSTNITTNSIWGIDGFGNITPIVTNNAVIATNIVRYGVGRMFGTESWLSKALTLTNGPNYIGAAENSQFFLIGPTTNPADCQIILSNAVATGQKLVLVNQTNAIPAEGAWTMTNNTPIPDGAGVVKLLGGFDLVSTNGYISYFEFISPDWQEVGRILASGASGLLTNVFNNIVVYSNITLKGNSTLTINNITLTTNDLWHTNLVGGAATLQPVNLGLQPLVGKGWLSGTNTPASGLLPLALPFNVLSSVRSEDIGDPAASYMYIAQARNNTNPKSFLSFVASTNALAFQLGSNDGTDQSTMNFVTANGSDMQFTLQKNSTNFTLLYPTRGATLIPYVFDTDKPHTTNDIAEISNNGAVELGVMFDGELYGPTIQTTGTNTVLGYQAFSGTAAGNQNVAIGQNAIQAQTRNYRVAVGYNALSAGGSGSAVAIGHNSAPSSTAANVTVGDSAGFALTTGGDNTLIGNGAGQGIVNGTHNTFVGDGSYAFNAKGSTLIGSSPSTAGEIITNLVNSVIVGNTVQTNKQTALTNVVTLGYNIVATNNNDVVIGNATNLNAYLPPNVYAGGVLLGSGGGGGNMTNTGASVVGMVPVATDTSGGSWSPTNNLTINLNSMVNVKASPYNAVGDGSHDDSTNIQAALNYAWGTNNTHTELNKIVYIPPGIYKLGTSLLVTNIRSAKLVGGGKYNTVLRSDSAGPCLRTDGMWFSQIEGIDFRAGVGGSFGLFELDGNIGHAGATIGVQGNTIKDCYFEGQGIVGNGLSIVPQGASFGQGSENLMLNCHFISCTNAGLAMQGYNALQNTVIGGNVQGCTNDGVQVTAGQVAIFSMGFQNEVNGFGSQGGYDIHIYNSGGTYNTAIGCRSESLRSIRADAGPVLVDGWQSYPSAVGGLWTSNTTYTLNRVIAPANANGFAFYVITNGVSGATEPTWLPIQFYPHVIVDGTVTWLVMDVEGIRIADGEVRNSTFPYVSAYLRDPVQVSHCKFSRNDWIAGSPGVYNDPGPTGIGPLLFGNTSQPFSVPLNSSTATVFTNGAPIQLGKRPLLWSAGTNGSTWGDVGFYRSDGTDSSGTDYANSKNALGVIGSLGKPWFGSATGDDQIILGGLGTNSGGKIRLMTQRSGASNAVDSVSIDNAGTTTISGNLVVQNNANISSLLIGSMGIGNRSVLTASGGILLVDLSLTNRYWSCSPGGNVQIVLTNCSAGNWGNVLLRWPSTNCMFTHAWCPSGSTTNWLSGAPSTNAIANTIGFFGIYPLDSTTNSTICGYSATQ